MLRTRAPRSLIADPGTSHEIPARVKAALLAEIGVTYLPALRGLRGNDLAAMVATARRTRVTGGPVAPEHQRDRAIRLGWIVGRVLSVTPMDSRCLIRSLVLTRMLARRGIHNTLVIGVKSGRPFKAHAWVEHEGRPVLPDNGFARLLEV
jgi:hypothetical protein